MHWFGAQPPNLVHENGYVIWHTLPKLLRPYSHLIIKTMLIFKRSWNLLPYSYLSIHTFSIEVSHSIGVPFSWVYFFVLGPAQKGGGHGTPKSATGYHEHAGNDLVRAFNLIKEPQRLVYMHVCSVDARGVWATCWFLICYTCGVSAMCNGNFSKVSSVTVLWGSRSPSFFNHFWEKLLPYLSMDLPFWSRFAIKVLLRWAKQAGLIS